MSHFENDARWIASKVQESPDNLVSTAVLVLLTIRQPFYGISAQVTDVRTKGATSSYLFGMKRDGYRYAVENKASLHNAVKDRVAGKITLDALILRFLEIPGLGIVKASFLAQMAVCEGACLDTHNLLALGLHAQTFKTPKTLQVATIARKIAAYNAVWRAIGDSAHWWNGWCDFVATLYPARFTDGAAVSAFHRLAIWEDNA